MLYDFQCVTCSGVQTHSFPMADYDKYVMDDGKLKRKKCPQCKTITLFRYIAPGHIPAIMGGTKNYMSMERYWAQNKGEQRRKEDALAKKMADRHEQRVTSNIDKQRERKGSDKRHEGYGSGHGEQKLSSDN
jgi:hypothetical protein